MKALAVDLGGTHAACALIEDRAILHAKTLAADGAGGLAPLLPRLAGALRSLLHEADTPASACAGLAFSFCGLADHAGGRVASTNAKYDDAPRLHLKAWCETSLGLRFEIENDARMALLGEWYAGAGQGMEDIVMITLGTGVGGAAMIQRRLLRGKHAQAGCLGGHLPVLYNGRRCTCGAIGCVEAEASGWSLPELCRAASGFASSLLAREKQITFERLFHHASAGDAAAMEVRDRCLKIWGAATVGLIHAYDPEMVIIGGGVMKSAAAILPFLQDYVARHAWTPWGKVSLQGAQLGNQAALLGAIPLLQGQAD